MANWFFVVAVVMKCCTKKKHEKDWDKIRQKYNDICRMLRLCILIMPQCHHMNTYKAYTQGLRGNKTFYWGKSRKKSHEISEVRVTNIYTQTRSHIDNKFICTCNKVSWVFPSSCSSFVYTRSLVLLFSFPTFNLDLILTISKPPNHTDMDCRY